MGYQVILYLSVSSRPWLGLEHFHAISVWGCVSRRGSSANSVHVDGSAVIPIDRRKRLQSNRVRILSPIRKEDPGLVG